MSPESTTNQFIAWLERRLKRSLRSWERAEVMDWIQRIVVELRDY